jgi:hypothetical protein
MEGRALSRPYFPPGIRGGIKGGVNDIPPAIAGGNIRGVTSPLHGRGEKKGGLPVIPHLMRDPIKEESVILTL